ncbi:SLAC1 anion channel family protein [Fluviibacter phosphoraccumulans]|uniref:SLAC1 anion channel family protein n=1 Tax=Fluviibacter phosphoraccumulans TaxID=1751046 RepID=UPI0024E1CF33|nr:SLAC1 anion channel family protein [Fluviibacter phosphoraccumulans]
MNTAESRLKNFPVSWFSTVMGMCGLSIAWNRAEHFFNSGFCLSSILLGITTLLFLVLLIIYTRKLIKYRAEVIEELKHPVKHAFFPTISISLLLLSAAYLQRDPDLSLILWVVGASLQLILTLYVLSSWMHHDRYEITHLNPAWFIPVVGNMIVPIAGVHHAPIEISWLFFSMGLFFWPILTSIIFYRLVFHTALPERLLPTLFIFIAPPAVGTIAWVTLIGHVDAFTHFMFSVGLVFTLLLFSQINHFRRIKFFLSWWAYSFPLAAMTIASLLMTKQTGNVFYLYLGYLLITILNALIIVLIWKTVFAIYRREICVAGH